VDFILCRGDILVAIEVKSGRRKSNLSGSETFSKEFPVKKKLFVGKEGIPVEEFLASSLEGWLV
jgi:hypothetical protein